MSSQAISKAVLWSAVDIFFNYGLNFIVIVVLSRLLTPHDFGLIAILSIFIGICSVFIDGGFGRALIQRQDISITDESSVFFFNLFMGILMAAAMCGLAPLFAIFYGEDILQYIVYAMAFNLFIGSFSSIHNALLSKKLNFKLIATIGAISSITSAVIGITCALQGMGVWSLVLKTLSGTALSAILLWSFHSWRPKCQLSFPSLRSLATFSGYLVISEIIYRVYNNLYSALVGKLYSPQDAGFLNQAQRLQQLPVNLITTVSARVSFSVFSASAHDVPRLAMGMRTALEMTIFVSVPVTLTLIVESEALIILLFGQQWTESIPLLRIIGIAAFLIPMQILNNTLLLSLGKSDIHFRLMVIKSALGILLLIALVGQGLVAVAWAFTLSKFINLSINTHFTGKFIGYTLSNQLRHIFPYILCSIPMSIILAGRQFFYQTQDYASLIVALAIGTACYVALCWSAKLEAFNRLLNLVNARVGTATSL